MQTVLNKIESCQSVKEYQTVVRPEINKAYKRLDLSDEDKEKIAYQGARKLKSLNRRGKK